VLVGKDVSPHGSLVEFGATAVNAEPQRD